MSLDFVIPDWPAPVGVAAASTTRTGGASPPPWDSLNLGEHVGDEAARVAENRRRLARALSLPEAPAWLTQVHGTRVLALDDPALPGDRRADAAVTARPGRVLAVLTADCAPVLLCRRDGGRVGVAHAGWRGLAAGVLEAAVSAMETAPAELLAWVGPAIGPGAYEVGPEVRQACLAGGGDAEACFLPGRGDRWQFDLPGLARRRLARLGLERIYGGQSCTASEPDRFFSHRRDGPCGRMATLVWIHG
ncbi:MAG: peptidoglycan editing factor PgeF [Gammaproteobacteria bacterium]